MHLFQVIVNAVKSRIFGQEVIKNWVKNNKEGKPMEIITTVLETYTVQDSFFSSFITEYTLVSKKFISSEQYYEVLMLMQDERPISIAKIS